MKRYAIKSLLKRQTKYDEQQDVQPLTEAEQEFLRVYKLILKWRKFEGWVITTHEMLTYMGKIPQPYLIIDEDPFKSLYPIYEIKMY